MGDGNIPEMVMNLILDEEVKWAQTDNITFRSKIGKGLVDVIAVSWEAENCFSLSIMDKDGSLVWEDTANAGGGRNENFWMYQEIWQRARNSANEKTASIIMENICMILAQPYRPVSLNVLAIILQIKNLGIKRT